MIGSAVVSLPWAFQQSGLLLGVILSTTSFLVSFYTTKLVIETAGTDKEYADTLKKYFGKSFLYMLTLLYLQQENLAITLA